LKAGTYLFDTDTDPAFCLNPDPIRMQGFADQKFQILTAEKIFKFFAKKMQLIHYQTNT
jgi:hypothetical protein